MRNPPLRAAALVMAWAALGACQRVPAGALAPAPAFERAGALCSASQRCGLTLVCVDGRCAARTWPPASRVIDAGASEPRPDAALVPAPDGALDALDGASDAGPDSGAPDAIAETDASTDAVSDAIVAPDTSPDDVDSGDVDSGDADADADAAPTLILRIVEDDAETKEGTGTVALSLGQAWVTELTMPRAGALIGMEALLHAVGGGKACGVFRPVVWLPDSQGNFTDAPSWQAPDDQPLHAAPGPQAFMLDQPPAVARGKVRLGLVFVFTCQGNPPVPALVADDTGDLARTWIWDPKASGTPWIPASALQLPGRWALRALERVIWR